MSGVPVSFACAAYDRMVPLLTREVKPEGIDFNFIPIAHPREIFDRMAARLEFDSCEFSSSEMISQLDYQLRYNDAVLRYLVLDYTENNRTRAAEVLGISREGLRIKMQRLGISS